jgi:hypothetical protein
VHPLIFGALLEQALDPQKRVTPIYDFRFKHRMPTRAAAVRELLRVGLTVAPTSGDGPKSSSYGISGRGTARTMEVTALGGARAQLAGVFGVSRPMTSRLPSGAPL